MADSFFPNVSYDIALNATPTSVASANPIGTGITTIRVVATVPCYISFGAAPVAAVGSSLRLAPNFPEYFSVAPGMKVAGISNPGAAGTITVTEVCG